MKFLFVIVILLIRIPFISGFNNAANANNLVRIAEPKPCLIKHKVTNPGRLIIVNKHHKIDRMVINEGVYLWKINGNDTEEVKLSGKSIRSTMLKGNNLVYYDFETDCCKVFQTQTNKSVTLPDSLTWNITTSDTANLYFLHITDDTKCLASIYSYNFRNASIKLYGTLDMHSMKIKVADDNLNFILMLPSPIVCNSPDGILVNQNDKWNNYLYIFSGNIMKYKLDMKCGGVINSNINFESYFVHMLLDTGVDKRFVTYDCKRNLIIRDQVIIQREVIDYFLISHKAFVYLNDDCLYEINGIDLKLKKVMQCDWPNYYLFDILKLE